jgi:hypothetical protein
MNERIKTYNTDKYNPSGGTTGVNATVGSTGLAINNTAQINAGSTITVRACIGWSNTTGQLTTQFEGSTGNPCRIFLPSVNYNNDYIKEIIQKPLYMVIIIVVYTNYVPSSSL